MPEFRDVRLKIWRLQCNACCTTCCTTCRRSRLGDAANPLFSMKSYILIQHIGCEELLNPPFAARKHSLYFAPSLEPRLQTAAGQHSSAMVLTASIKTCPCESNLPATSHDPPSESIDLVIYPDPPRRRLQQGTSVILVNYRSIRTGTIALKMSVS